MWFREKGGIREGGKEIREVVKVKEEEERSGRGRCRVEMGGGE